MIPIVPLVTMDYAQKHLITNDSDDVLLAGYLLLASNIVMNHCKLTEIPEEWVLENPNSSPPIEEDETPTDIGVITTTDGIVFRVPSNIQAAVLFITAEMFESRESATTDPLSPAIINLLAPYRDPTFA